MTNSPSFLEADWPEPIKSRPLNGNSSRTWTSCKLVAKNYPDQFLIKVSAPILCKYNGKGFLKRLVFNRALNGIKRHGNYFPWVSGKTILKDFYRFKNGGFWPSILKINFDFFIYSRIFENVSFLKKILAIANWRTVIPVSKDLSENSKWTSFDIFFTDLKKKELVRIWEKGPFLRMQISFTTCWQWLQLPAKINYAIKINESNHVSNKVRFYKFQMLAC